MSTYNQTISDGVNDALENMSESYFSSTGVNLVMHSNTSAGSQYVSGLRFTAVGIGNGDTINTAVVTGYVTAFAEDDPNIDIACQDVDNAVDFSSDADVAVRWAGATTAQATLTTTGVGTGNYALPDMASSVKEVIDRGGWSSGNALVILLHGKSDANFSFTFKAYEAGSDPASIAIDFTAGGAGADVRQHMMMQGLYASGGAP